MQARTVWGTNNRFVAAEGREIDAKNELLENKKKARPQRLSCAAKQEDGKGTGWRCGGGEEGKGARYEHASVKCDVLSANLSNSGNLNLRLISGRSISTTCFSSLVPRFPPPASRFPPEWFDRTGHTRHTTMTSVNRVVPCVPRPEWFGHLEIIFLDSTTME
ncbi:unnamed protein product [Toxocara canis]|uniref:Uncharacterized protein n=1 Tax=Toxocara canis TaxID=6265 RepID=A0A183UW24_TOXCA|nr:unnamed protein product [Toxocara canis]